MARKRMISPEIWTSRNFSELSNFEKIVFISLFSHADDEGRGEADPTYISSMTFPYDKNRRDSDVKKALTKIAQTMSVQLYSVKGNDYYYMTSWKRWQKIDKPSKSKLPPPPFVGVGGGIPKSENFDECSGNVRGVFAESSPNEIENNIKEINNIPPDSACAQEDTEFESKFNSFCSKYGIGIDSNSPFIADFDFDLLDKAYSESTTYLQDKDKYPAAHTLSWIVRNYQSIIIGKYKDKKKAVPKKSALDGWQAMYEKYSNEDDEDET